MDHPPPPTLRPHRPEAEELNSELLSETNHGVDLGGRCRGTTPPQNENLWFSNTTGILQNMQISMI